MLCKTKFVFFFVSVLVVCLQDLYFDVLFKYFQPYVSHVCYNASLIVKTY